MIVDLLKHLRSLVELSLEPPYMKSGSLFYPISRELIESFHAHRISSLRSSISPIVPNLRSLVLKVKSNGFHHTSFISTIFSRWIPDQAYAAKIGVYCLRSVDLHLAEPVSQADYLPLAHYEKSGMRIVVKGG